MKNLKNSKQNTNSIPTSILKDNVGFISLIVSDLINLCFVSGKFPNILKRAVVLPLYKKGDDTSMVNYRPISLLPWLSKIIEKCIESRLLDYICKKYNIKPRSIWVSIGNLDPGCCIAYNREIIC